MVAKKAAKKVVKKAKILKPAKPMIKLPLSIKKSFSKSEIIKHLNEAAGIAKKEATHVMNSIASIIEAHLSKRGPGEFVLPGMAKFRVIRKPATKARKGINPFTGQPTVFAAKPARNVVKIKPLKKLKDIVK